MDAARLSGRERVLEIGSGPGTMTAMIAEQAAEVLSVEIDAELMDWQRDYLENFKNISFFNEDILDFDIASAAAGGGLVVIGNIPYSITSPILGKLLKHAALIDRAVLCLQDEVAVRIASEPGSKAFGRISLAVRYRASVDNLFRISKMAFRPRPRVGSRVIGIRFHHPPPCPAADEDLLFALARALFGTRRKMIRNSLRSFHSFSSEELQSVEEQSGVDLSSRPERLDVAEWCDLAEAVGKLL